MKVHTGTFDDLHFFLVYFVLAQLFEKLKFELKSRRKPKNCVHDTHQKALTIDSDALLLICYVVRVFSTASQPEKRQRPS